MAEQPAPTDNISFGAFSGIKNTVTRERLKPDELEIAKNVDIDDVGQLHRRRGYTRVSVGDYHSLFTASNGAVYGVKDGTLGRINPDYSFQSIATGVGNRPLAYAQVDDTVYFSSEITSGKFSRTTLVPAPWGALAADRMWLSPVVNPTPTLPPIKGKTLKRPPLATALTTYNGRIYLADGKTVWATELYLYDWVDAVKGFLPFEADVTLLAAVTDGFYVGTTGGVYFQSGIFNELRRVDVMNSGALPGSAVTLPPHLIPDQYANNTKSAILMLTQQGLCLGLDGGNFINLTQTRVVFPQAIRVNSLFRSQDGVNQYIGVADSGGSPSSNTRIGDYVDAEIRRFQGA